MDESKINNPRRLEANDEIVQYLITLDKQLSEKGLDDSDPEVTETLVNNVLSEIKTRCASLASDRRTSLIIEKLVLFSTLPQLLDFCRQMSPYALFLARNRYSSHALQSLISRLCHLLKTQDNSDDLDQFNENVLELLNPILADLCWLAKDVSATHVIRSSICLLVGVPVIAERKGKNSKHQHSVSHSMTLESMMVPGKFVVDEKFKFNVPPDFHDAIRTASITLSQTKSSTLHELLADPCSAAVLTQLFRLLASPGILSDGIVLADNILRQAIEWPLLDVLTFNEDDDLLNSSLADAATVSSSSSVGTGDASQLFYAMAGDRAASHFLETAIECGRIHTLLPLLQLALVTKVAEYAQDSAGNFVVQAVLRRLGAEIDRVSMSITQQELKDQAAIATTLNKKNKKKSKQLNLEMDGECDDLHNQTATTAASSSSSISDMQLLQRMIQLSEIFMNEILSDTLFTDLMAQKGGVILWLIILSKSVCDSGYHTDDWRHRVSTAVVSNWTQNNSRTLSSYIVQKLSAVAITSDTADAADAKANEIKTKNNSVNHNGRNPNTKKPAGGDGGADSVKVILARQLGALLRLKGRNNNNSNNSSSTSNNNPTKIDNTTTIATSSSSSSSSSRTLEAIISAVANLPAETLKSVAQSGQLSRAMLDPLIELHAHSSHFHKYITTFIIIAPELAGHYVGQHLFRQTYEKVSEAKEKEKLIKSLLPVNETLSKTKEGRNSLKLIDMEGYIHDATEWMRNIKRQARAVDMLKELEGTSSKSSNNNNNNSKSNNKGNNNNNSNNNNTVVDKGKIQQIIQKIPAPSKINQIPTTTSNSNNNNKNINTNHSPDNYNNNYDDDDDDDDNEDNTNTAVNNVTKEGGGRKRKRKRTHKSNGAVVGMTTA